MAKRQRVNNVDDDDDETTDTKCVPFDVNKVYYDTNITERFMMAQLLTSRALRTSQLVFAEDGSVNDQRKDAKFAAVLAQFFQPVKYPPMPPSWALIGFDCKQMVDDCQEWGRKQNADPFILWSRSVEQDWTKLPPHLLSHRCFLISERINWEPYLTWRDDPYVGYSSEFKTCFLDIARREVALFSTVYTEDVDVAVAIWAIFDEFIQRIAKADNNDHDAESDNEYQADDYDEYKTHLLCTSKLCDELLSCGWTSSVRRITELEADNKTSKTKRALPGSWGVVNGVFEWILDA